MFPCRWLHKIRKRMNCPSPEMALSIKAELLLKLLENLDRSLNIIFIGQFRVCRKFQHVYIRRRPNETCCSYIISILAMHAEQSSNIKVNFANGHPKKTSNYHCVSTKLRSLILLFRSLMLIHKIEG